MFPPYPIDFVRFPLYPFECSRLLRLILFVSRLIRFNGARFPALSWHSVSIPECLSKGFSYLTPCFMAVSLHGSEILYICICQHMPLLFSEFRHADDLSSKVDKAQRTTTRKFCQAIFRNLHASLEATTSSMPCVSLASENRQMLCRHLLIRARTPRPSYIHVDKTVIYIYFSAVSCAYKWYAWRRHLLYLHTRLGLWPKKQLSRCEQLILKLS